MISIDVVVIGSGFSGSILSWILASEGLRVAMIDPVPHPRFAIGESSTPIADLLLRRLGDQYGLPQLKSLSAWGSWQRELPHLACGRKRGFSYYMHDRGHEFSELELGSKSLVVAASTGNEVADTHWYRADVDQFLFEQAIQAGVLDFSGYSVVSFDKSGSDSLVLCDGPTPIQLKSDWVIDASGRSGVLPRLTGAVDRCGELRTRTHCAFGHYRGVESWTEHLRAEGLDSTLDPFDGDDAAQHHLLGRGWLWMLRFNNDVTSIGFTAPTSDTLDWSGYPSIERLLRGATLVNPKSGPPRTKRLQRLFDPIIDERSLLLPTAAVTLDPLHSTGIAHGLAGLERIARMICEPCESNRAEMLEQYQRSIVEETRLLDRMVATAYATIDDFARFTTACMLYFAAAIRCEERLLGGENPSHLWNADDPSFVEMVNSACQRLENRAESSLESIRDHLAPWNSAGLMNAGVANRYAYTATEKGIRFPHR